MKHDHSLYELGLLDAPEEEAYDRLTRLASEIMGVPVSLVSIVEPEKDRQYFKSMCGLPEPWASARQTPLSHSFCQYVRYSGAPLAVEDAREHPFLKYNRALPELGVISYLGVPLRAPGGKVVGAFCVIGGEPRQWGEEEIERLGLIGRCVEDQIRMAAALHEREDAIARAQEAEAARETFFSTTGHELRTPLGGILGAVESISRHLTEPVNLEKAREMAGAVDHSARTLLRVLNDLLDLSRIDAGKLELDPRPFDLSATLRSVTRLHAEAARSKGITLDLTDHVPPLAVRRMGDDHRLSQVVGNLLSNAVRFVEQGRIEVVARTSGARVLISVEDTGIGMTEEQLARLFVPFEQASAGTSRVHGGTGLGMAIVDRIVTQMGGRIEVTSAPGEGTRVDLDLPMPPAPAFASATISPRDEPPAATRGPSDLHSAAARLGGRCVLVAEDDEVNLALIGEMLDLLGVEMIAAQTGDAALARATSPMFDALLIDVNLPGMSGHDVIRRVRAAEKAAGLPRRHALAWTADATQKQLETCLGAGFDARLVKPLTLQDLVAGLSEADLARSA
ncbi:MAG: ATP-binding protein [Roseovarius sp.]